MSILLIRNDKNYQPWLNALKKADATVEVVTPETVENPEAVTMALTWKAPKNSFDNYSNLKVIGSMGAGVDHLFTDPTLPQDLIYTRIIDENLSSDMAEFVLALCLRHIKNLGLYQDLQVEKQWKPTSYKRHHQVTIGIMGMGVLGKAVAETLVLNNFNVRGWSQTAKSIDGVHTFIADELDTFLSSCDILVCLLPLTDQTAGILNQQLFEKLPKGAFLINVARGGHLNEQDLMDALTNKTLSCAALDVFDQEPLPQDHTFWNEKRILITPHVASMSDPTSVVDQVVENYHRLQSGEQLMNTVNIDQQY